MNSTFHLVQIGTPFLIHRYPSQRRVRFKRRVSCTAPDSPQDPEEDAESRIERLEAASRGRSSSKPTPVDSVSDSEPKRQVWNEGKLLPEDWEDLSFAEKAWALYAGERGALYWANSLMRSCLRHSVILAPLSIRRKQIKHALTRHTINEVPPLRRTVRRFATLDEAVLQDVDLRTFKDTEVDVFDLVIAGAGPSGLSVGARVAKAGYRVCIVDPDPLSLWPNNYGVWVDEFEAMGLEDCLQKIWSKSEVYLENNDSPRVLNRPYARVDRPKLKKRLLSDCTTNGVYFKEAKVDSVVDLSYAIREVHCSENYVLKTRLVLDATGHSRKLINYDKEFNPGYQGAYGYIAKVKSHPFDTDTMLFMDWRDSYTQDDPEMKEKAQKLPTFLYAMPFSETEIFIEETSLVSRPIAPFNELRERLEKRVQHLGIEILSRDEEEYCSIPMGGVLPQNPQSVLGIGGTAGMVHPSTGYMISRMLGAVPVLADSIIDQLDASKCVIEVELILMEWFLEKQWKNGDGELIANDVWRALWPIERIRQREFFCFGMAVLLQLNLKETRNFFSAFFSLSDYHWQGFLSSRLSFSELIGFGWSLFVKSSSETRVTILKKGAPGLGGLIFGIVPTLIQE
eukprot:g3074.t1